MADGWFIRRNNERLGPFTWLEMTVKVSQGELKPTDRIARKGMTKWAEARSIEGLFSATPLPPIPPRPAATVKPPPVPEQVFAAAIVAEPVPTPIVSAVPGKRSGLPYILAGLVGGGISLLAAFVLLGFILYWSSARPADSAAVADITGQNPGLAEMPTAGSGPAEVASPEGPALSGAPTTDLADLQSTLQDLQKALGDAQPAVPPLIAALVAKAESGDVEAMNELGDRYSEGAGVTTDEAVAVGWYQKAADGGSSDAMNSLAYMYVKGQGVDPDQAIAAQWFAKGAQAGSPMSMYNYAVCLANGVGVPENQFGARLWIQKSAEAGYAPAQKWIQAAQAEARANILGAIVGGILGGSGGDDDSSNSADAEQEMFQERRRNREYWEDRARRADAAGNQMEADFARQNVP